MHTLSPPTYIMLIPHNYNYWIKFHNSDIVVGYAATPGNITVKVMFSSDPEGIYIII